MKKMNILMAFLVVGVSAAHAIPCLDLSSYGGDSRLIANLETAIVENASIKYQNDPSAENTAALNSALEIQVQTRGDFLSLCMDTLKNDKKNCLALTAKATESRLVAGLETALMESASVRYKANPTEENKKALDVALEAQVQARAQFVAACFAI